MATGRARSNTITEPTQTQSLKTAGEFSWSLRRIGIFTTVTMKSLPASRKERWGFRMATSIRISLMSFLNLFLTNSLRKGANHGIRPNHNIRPGENNRGNHTRPPGFIQNIPSGRLDGHLPGQGINLFARKFSPIRASIPTSMPLQTPWILQISSCT